MELTLEEMDQEIVEYLPPREVMCCWCRPCCEPSFEVRVDIDVCIGL